MPYFNCYIENPLVRENVFPAMPREEREPPTYGQAAPLLPRPFWTGHPETIACYDKVWELAFANLRRPTPGNGFVANYIDTAFNDHLFMWDSAFILLFARYGRRAFDFQRTLDNLYAKQHPDGFICREIDEEDGTDCFQRFDPASTGPNVMPWTEWEYYLNFGDRDRLGRVFPVLLAYHRWLRAYRTWPDGTYWSSGWGCGMDNQPRLPPASSQEFFHGHLSWIDACLQQILSADLLLEMGEVLGRAAELADLRQEAAFLGRFVNDRMWDENTAFYYDRRPDGSLTGVKSVAAYWALLAGVVPPERLARFVAHLDDPREFLRTHRVPSLSADHPGYHADGAYWLGGVWAPTNYMILRGLSRVGRDELAHRIALNHLDNVVQVFQRTGTVWENYAPEEAAPGKPAKADFVGWTGLPPVAVLLEYILGLRADVPARRLVWDVRLTDEHGVSGYPFGPHGVLDVLCPRRATAEERPAVEIRANIPVTVEVRWARGTETIKVGGPDVHA